MQANKERGFTLIELMIVVVIIGILASVALPNFISMQDRAREGSVKANMHTLQTGVEDFAIINNGTYPVAADGPAVEALMAGTVVPENPFTHAPTVINWGGPALTQGNLGYELPGGLNQYLISGYGAAALLAVQLKNY